MKRLLFLLPLLFIVLNVLPLSLQKDQVQLNSNGKTLTPSSWQIIHNTRTGPASAFIADPNIDPQKTTEQPTTSQVVSTTYRGFPFGAYVHEPQVIAAGRFTVTAWQWLWAALDIVIVLTTLVLAWAVNRRPRKAKLQEFPAHLAQPIAAPQPQPAPQPTNIDYKLPDPVIVPPTVAQPPQQPPAGPSQQR